MAKTATLPAIIDAPTADPLVRRIKSTWDRADDLKAKAETFAAHARDLHAKAEAIFEARCKPLHDRGRKAHDAYVQADWDADRLHLEVGAMLIDLKKRVGHGRWRQTVRLLGRSERRCQELMQAARGDESLDEQRQRKRASVREVRARAALQPERSADLPPDHLPADAFEESRPWQDDLRNVAGYVLAWEANAERHAPGWRDRPVPSDLKTLMRDAGVAFARLVAIIEQAETETDPLSIH
jgi:hypothetical protein